MGSDSKTVRTSKKQRADQAASADQPGQLPEHLQNQQQYMTCGDNLNYNVSIGNSAHLFSALGIDNSWSHKKFQRDLRVAMKWVKGNDMEFDIIGIDPAIANALRRILISEIPTVAIEHVYMVQNTSIIACEVLSHRLGLVPVLVDPDLLKDKLVKSGQLVWLPNGSEMPEETNCRFASSQSSLLGAEGARLVHDDILLAKMRPGQEIVLEAHCIRGIGAEHAKWSPVATAWYRLQPEVVILEPIVGSKADSLAQICPGLFTVEGSGPSRRAVAGNARQHEKQLEKVRRMSGEEEWSEHLQLRKRKDHFIFTIESTGILPPHQLFLRSLDQLAAKCDKLLEHL
ncbi:g8862 [Coccomyxa elongata]